MKANKIIIPILIFIGILMIYYFTSPGRTPYDYFTRLATAFLGGKYWLTQNPPWLSELIILAPGRFTFVNPIMPAILLVPLVAIFGASFPQQYLAHILGAGATVLAGILAYKLKKDMKLAIWTSLFLGLGSIFFYLSATGSVWYLGQVTCTFFLLLAILEVSGKKRSLLLGLTLSGAFLSRTQVTLSLPFFLILLLHKRFNIKSAFLFLTGLIPFVVIFFSYNFLRFGNIFQTGYVFIPGLLKEPWFARGVFNPIYIGNHLKVLFLALPIFLSKFPYIRPSWGGLAIWITSPGFIYLIFTSLKEIRNRLALISVFLIALVNFSFGSTGFSQFGYRYAVDFYPFLLILLISGVARQRGPKWHHWLLLTLGIIVNFWGVLWINKFGWVSF
jgi:hypothetical protein